MHTDTASRNEASLNDVFVYRWPKISASTRLEKDEMMMGKDDRDNDDDDDNLTDLSCRGIPVIELGVPENFRTLDFSALDYSTERLERFVLRYVLIMIVLATIQYLLLSILHILVSSFSWILLFSSF